MEPPLLMPTTKLYSDDHSPVTFLDRQGDLVTLPRNALVPFARMAARTNIQRIKRFHIGSIFKQGVLGGHPETLKAAVFDIITPDLAQGTAAAAAEAIALVNECINSFPGLAAAQYEISITHSKLKEVALKKIPIKQHKHVLEILSQSKSSFAQKRAALLRLGLSRSIVDDLEMWTETDDLERLILKLDKASIDEISEAVVEIRDTIQYATWLAVNRPILLRPIIANTSFFRNGIYFEAVRGQKRSDMLAAGGRYDHIFAQIPVPSTGSNPIRAIGLQISVDKITGALATHQRIQVKDLVKERKSFGLWSARRCDVYVMAYQKGQLLERLDVVALLWQHGISADVMYDSALDSTEDNPVAGAAREGILFLVFPRPRPARRDIPAFKVKSVLRGTEYDVSRQDLPNWLLHQLAEQKRVDLATAGVGTATLTDLQTSSNLPAPKEAPSAVDIQILLPPEGIHKKQRKQTKQIYMAKAYQMDADIREYITSGIPLIGIDVPPSTFNALITNYDWLTEEDSWRGVVAEFPHLQNPYAIQIRETIAKYKLDGHRFVILFSLRDDRVFLYHFQK